MSKYNVNIQMSKYNVIIHTMSAKARHQHALECYSTTEQRARGLRQWIQMVIEEIINKDLQEITLKVSRAAHQLRVERIRLMKVKAVLSVTLDRGEDSPETLISRDRESIEMTIFVCCCLLCLFCYFLPG